MSIALVVMGVAGVGKSTVAGAVADQLGWLFSEGDGFHPPANIAKMQAGEPLTDADRMPWLADIRDWINDRSALGAPAVVSCSALRRSYRDVLREADADLRFAHLVAPEAVLRHRMSTREAHFMAVSMLESQLAVLEPLSGDEDGREFSAELPLTDVVTQITDWARQPR